VRLFDGYQYFLISGLTGLCWERLVSSGLIRHY
jgi:hypothetical protein